MFAERKAGQLGRPEIWAALAVTGRRKKNLYCKMTAAMLELESQRQKGEMDNICCKRQVKAKSDL